MQKHVFTVDWIPPYFMHKPGVFMSNNSSRNSHSDAFFYVVFYVVLSHNTVACSSSYWPVEHEEHEDVFFW